MPFNVGPMELIVVLIIALVVLGPKKLPEVGKSLGQGMRELQGVDLRHGRQRRRRSQADQGKGLAPTVG